MISNSIPEWQRDKARADIYLPAIKRLLGELFIGEASKKEDQEQATDLVLSVSSLTVACRVRSRSDYDKPGYPDEITIRYARRGCSKTEWQKFEDGWGDYMVYAFGADGGELHAVTVIDLRHFRAQLIRQQKEPMARQIKINRDGVTQFAVVKISSLNPACIRYRRGPKVPF
jgi:hypothetical protein